MKLKYLVAALGLVASAASYADISPAAGSNPVAPTGGAEMLLVVWDANSSYTLDLGITYTQFLSQGTSTLTTLGGTNWSSFLATADQSSWQYALIDAKTNNAGNNAAILSTVDASYVGLINSADNNIYSSNIQNAQNQIGNFQVAVGATGTHTTVANGDSVNAVGTPGYFLTTSMDTFNSFAYLNAIAVGSSAAVELVQRNTSGISDPTETLLGTATFAKSGSNYVLSYASVAAVPEPTGYALALAGFGVLGFIGRRRRDYK